MPKLGIFWFFKGQVFGRARSLSEGCERWPGLLDGPDDHIRLWEDRTLKKPLSLAGLDYTEVPRGRVIFSRKDRRALIYLDECLSSATIRRRIKAFFGLQTMRVTWKRDPHYTTHPDKLDALFSQRLSQD